MGEPQTKLAEARFNRQWLTTVELCPGVVLVFCSPMQSVEPSGQAAEYST